MTFRVGQEVVCIDDTPSVWRADEIYPVKGEKYTIRELTDFGKKSLRLVEIVNKPKVYQNGFDEVCFLRSRFRPIVKTDISVFTAMLKKHPIKQDAMT